MLGLIAGWIGSIVIVAGPYVGMHYAFTEVLQKELPQWLALSYWIVMVTYLLAAATIQPDYDRTELGWFGGLVDNPFSWEDDNNRRGLFLDIALIPGRVVCWTLHRSWQVLFSSKRD